MELIIHFTALPEKLTLDMVKSDLAELLEDDGWLTGSGADYLELELEDEKVNPKYGILTVKGYLQKARFAPDTTIELAGTPVASTNKQGGYFYEKSHRHFTDCLWRGPAGRGRADHRGGKRTTECPGSAWKGSSFLSREDAALWERLSRFWADVARQDAAAAGVVRAGSRGVLALHGRALHAEEYIRANCEYQGTGRRGGACGMDGGRLCFGRSGVAEGQERRFHAVSFFRFAGGRITRLDEYWADDGPPPQWRKESTSAVPSGEAEPSGR